MNMLLYLLQVTLCWGLFALLYTLLLRKETFFRANRVYLLSTAAAGCLLPLSGAWLPLPQNDVESMAWALPVIAVGFRQMEEAAAAWSWNDILIWVYGSGLAVTLTRLFWGLSRLANLVIRNPKGRLPDGAVLVYTEKTRLPFSFFHWIFVPYHFEDQPGFKNMLHHERAHVLERHSIDVMLMEMLCVVLWFHPLAHWYRKSLRNVHEYLADAAAVQDTNRRQYGHLLLLQAQGNLPALAHHFLQSPLRQRIVMLTRENSAPGKVWKYALALPLVALFLLAFRQQTPFPANVPAQAGGNGDTVYKTCDKLPEFPGGMRALIRFMETNLIYPEADQKTGRSGTIGVTFVVGTGGEVEHIQTTTLKGAPSAAMHTEAARIVDQMPRWLPAEHRGKTVKCQFVLPVRFALQ